MERLDGDTGDRCAIKERVIDWCRATIHWKKGGVHVDAAVGCGVNNAGGDQDAERNGDNEVWGWTGGGDWELIEVSFEFQEERE